MKKFETLSRAQMKNVKGGNCLPNEFECNNGNCISEAQVMDGIIDCADGSDEVEGANNCKNWMSKPREACFNCCLALVAGSYEYCASKCGY